MSENVNVTGWIYDVRKKRQVTVPTKKDKEPIVETWYKVSWCKMSRTKQGRRSKFVGDKIAVLMFQIHPAAVNADVDTNRNICMLQLHMTANEFTRGFWRS